ncbi:MAG TPA: MFS transporter [Marmoricola sp.]|nr:MFS transporter [Marmoricola sp.]
MSALRHLVRLLHGVWFRRLFSVRVASQLTDGVFQVALASYALFSDDQPSPASIAAALAVVLLPFSVLGPFAGVLLDRWSRRQVLLWGNLARVAIAAVVAAVVAAGLPDLVFYGVVLLCLSVNRFLLAGLSAALPHTVEPDDLLTANALTPTAGTLAFIVGLGVGGVARAAGRGAGWDGDVTVLLAAAVLYGVAGSLALRIPRRLLGPELDEVRPAVRHALGGVVSGLVDGLRHLRSRPVPAAGLAVIASHRYWFGISSVALVLLYRNHFHTPEETEAAFRGLSTAALVGGAGFVAAAVVTPIVTERVSPRTWVLALLVLAGLVQLYPAGLYTEGGILVAAFVLGLASQGIKICVDTFVQTGIDDVFRGRVFSLYDVLFNVAFVAAAATAAVVLPGDGRSYAVLGVLSAGYLLTALAYARSPRGAP